jgi:hypothetical protein
MRAYWWFYFYGSFASMGLTALIVHDKPLSNFFISGLLSWGGFAARIAAEVLKP